LEARWKTPWKTPGNSLEDSWKSTGRPLEDRWKPRGGPPDRPRTMHVRKPRVEARAEARTEAPMPAGRTFPDARRKAAGRPQEGRRKAVGRPQEGRRKAAGRPQEGPWRAPGDPLEALRDPARCRRRDAGSPLGSSLEDPWKTPGSPPDALGRISLKMQLSLFFDVDFNTLSILI